VTLPTTLERSSRGLWFALASLVVIGAVAIVAFSSAQLPGIPVGLGISIPPSGLIALGGSGGTGALPGSGGANGSGLAAGSPSGSVAPGGSGSPGDSGSPEGSVAPDGSPGPGGSPAPGTCADPPAGVLPAAIAFHGSRAAKVVALTFDDGWDAPTTLKILAILRRDHVNATFFPVGHAIELQPTAWRSVAKAGFPIGDHTYDHKDLTTLCFAAQVTELTRQQSIVTRTLGVSELPVMRPPFGTQNGLTRVAASVAGDVQLVLWDVDTQDWEGRSAAQIASRALAGGNGSIILMHTFAPNTAIALPRIIAGYRARGYRFVTIGQLLGVPGAVPFPPKAGTAG